MPGLEYEGVLKVMNFDDMKKKAQDALGEHGDKVNQGIDRAADAAKSRFGDHADTIDKVADKAHGMVGGQEQQGHGEEQGYGREQGGEYGRR